jgi:hypothetical protein
MSVSAASYPLQQGIEGPAPSAAAPLALLGSPAADRSAASGVQINQQFIAATASTMINSVAGNANLGPQAQELLDLIERFGGPDASTLRGSALPSARPPRTSAPTCSRSTSRARACSLRRRRVGASGRKK